MSTFTSLLFYCIFILILGSVFSNECKQRSDSICTCEYSDGRIVSLNKLKNFVEEKYNNLTYYFHACSDADATNLIPNKAINSTACKLTSLCLFNSTNGTVTSLGNTKNIHLKTLNDVNTLIIKTEKTEAVISLACTNNFLKTRLVVENSQSSNHNLTLYSPDCCAFYEYTGLSTGSMLVIQLLVFSAVYFLIGIALRHFLMGAQGREMIPHIDFWRDLPSLVKDGALFLQNGCKPVILSTSESYDRI